ncbi:hypothetical protein HYV43_06520 [Candidatus Micrarchaeota archaeon]|nr:hypothetical protein [Candidatus Micrarchaeota archaeon]
MKKMELEKIIQAGLSNPYKFTTIIGIILALFSFGSVSLLTYVFTLLWPGQNFLVLGVLFILDAAYFIFFLETFNWTKGEFEKWEKVAKIDYSIKNRQQRILTVVEAREFIYAQKTYLEWLRKKPSKEEEKRITEFFKLMIKNREKIETNPLEE